MRIGRAAALALLALLAGCGRYGGVRSPPGSSYPQVYPAAALATAPATATPIPAPPHDPRFTRDGAYIDPSTKVPAVYPTAVTQGLPASPYPSGMQPFNPGTVSVTTFGAAAP